MIRNFHVRYVAVEISKPHFLGPWGPFRLSLFISGDPDVCLKRKIPKFKWRFIHLRFPWRMLVLFEASKFCIGKMMLYWPSSLLHFFTSSCNENLLLFYICPHSAQVFTCINDTTRSPYWSPHQPLGHFQWAHLLLFRSKSNVCTLDHVCKLVVWCLC